MNDIDPTLIEHLSEKLKALFSEMVELDSSIVTEALALHKTHRRSARNLAHYLALRRHDVRQLQSQLALLGLSSLGRTESHVIGGLQAVMKALNQLAGSAEASIDLPDGVPTIGEGAALLGKNSEVLLGPPPPGRNVRIMVTMPSEAATDYDLVRDLVLHGMDCMRINCAHDGPEEWSGMVHNLRRAAKEILYNGAKERRVYNDFLPRSKKNPVSFSW
jgi:pyruvate kinase